MPVKLCLTQHSSGMCPTLYRACRKPAQRGPLHSDQPRQQLAVSPSCLPGLPATLEDACKLETCFASVEKTERWLARDSCFVLRLECQASRRLP